jgi:hypothetical protein
MFNYVYEPNCVQEEQEVVEHRLQTGIFTHGHPFVTTIVDVKKDARTRKLVKTRVELFAVRGLIDGKLNVLFYPERFNEPVMKGLQNASTLFQAVHWVSCKTNLSICPIAVVRDFGDEVRNKRQSIRITNNNGPKQQDGSEIDLTDLGPGILVPQINSRPLMDIDGQANARLNLSGTTDLHINDALAFDFLVGSGQFLWAPYCVAQDGTVFSSAHFQAFSYTANGRMAAALKSREGQVSMDFIRKLVVFIETPMHLGDLLSPLLGMIDIPAVKLFEKVLNSLCDGRIGNHVCIRPIERDS